MLVPNLPFESVMWFRVALVVWDPERVEPIHDIFGAHVKPDMLELGWWWLFCFLFLFFSWALQQVQHPFFFFPESVWAKGSSNGGGLLYIFICSHLHHIFSSSHLLIFTCSLSLSLCLLPSVSLLLSLFSLKAVGGADEAPRYGHRFARNEVRVSKTAVKLRFWSVRGYPFARNEVRVSKTEGFLRVWLVLLKGLRVQVLVRKSVCV